MMRRIFAAAAMSALAMAPTTVLAATFLTDSAVFSTNGEGNNWNGMIWNTQPKPDDRWNLYYSDSSDPDAPNFINAGGVASDEVDPRISIALAPGHYDFLVYGEAATADLDPLQHFVLNLYFNGNQSSPAISGLYGPDCPTVCAASHPNGLDLLGVAGAPEAGVLSFTDGKLKITLTDFTWALGDAVDKVWPYWSDVAPYSSGSGTPDFVGSISLTVTNLAEVPLPASMPALAGATGLLAAAGYRRRRGTQPRRT